jgi:hypothetical protein
LSSGNASLRRCAVAIVATALGACASQASLQKVVEQQSLPATVELTGTPFFPQSDYQCGPAALATLLGAAGAPVAPQALTDEIYLPGRRGSLQPEIVAAIRERRFVPYVVEQELAALLGELEAGRPVLVLQRLGIGPWPAWHYAVLVGYDAATGEVVLRSGTQARRRMSVRQFTLTWDRAERWGVVALPAGVLPASPNFTHYMTAVAGLESSGKARGDVRKAYEAASRRWPDEPLPWLGLANLAAADADWVAAERSFSQAVARAPDNLAAHNNHAESLRRLGCVRAAQEAIAAAQRLAAPDHPLRATVEATAADVAAAAASAAGKESSDCPK